MLSDLRAEIKPHGILDLERVASRNAIDASYDLKHAIKTKSIQIGRHTVIRPKPNPTQIIEREKIVEKNHIDEDKLANIIRGVVSEEIKKIPKPEKPQEEKHFDFNDLFNQIRDQINSINVNNPSKPQQDMMGINPEKFAEISQKSVDKISEDIETGKNTNKKSIQIINKNKLKDLASEL